MRGSSVLAALRPRLPERCIEGHECVFLQLLPDTGKHRIEVVGADRIERAKPVTVFGDEVDIPIAVPMQLQDGISCYLVRIIVNTELQRLQMTRTEGQKS